MASRVDAGAGATAPHVCPQCNRSFARKCDLNKHSVYHTRPYKCKVADCKYKTLGLPTQKALERHENDRHVPCPRTFPCLYEPCDYRSKRESNCKQHMKNIHQRPYERSKAKRSQPPARQRPTEEQGNPPVAAASPQLPTGPFPGMDFILFDDDQVDAIGNDDHALCPESYLPWASPNTRVRDRETVIDWVTQVQPHNNVAVKATEAIGAADILVDPLLSGPTIRDFGNHQDIDASGLFVNDPAVKVEAPLVTEYSFVPKKRKHALVENPSGDPTSDATPPSGQQPFGGLDFRTGQASWAPSKPAPDRPDGCDEYNCPPKRPKLSPAETFTDTTMPCIFRRAHPNIYDRNQMERYSPCHTLHHSISTLLRHLSRQAHRFAVNDRFVSSFDVQDEGFRHPRAGLCRWCWRAFSDRSTFDAHLSASCGKVSKGKREKWLVLHDTFSPLADSGSPAPNSSRYANECQSPKRTSSFSLEGLPISNYNGSCLDVYGTPPTSVPSPILPSSGFATSDPRDYTPVSADEHRRLQNVHRDLRENHQRLQQVTQVLPAPYIAMGRGTHPSFQPPTDRPSEDSHPASTAEAPDRGNLVQHMDSQFTDSDAYNVCPFMEEMDDEFPSRQTLSGMNTGFSTFSRTSTVHHVPWPVELPGLDGDRGDEPKGQQCGKPMAHRPPPASIPDSGYGTEGRRFSVGDVMCHPEGDRLLTPMPALQGCDGGMLGINNDYDNRDGEVKAAPTSHDQQHHSGQQLFGDAHYGLFDSEQDPHLPGLGQPEFTFRFP